MKIGSTKPDASVQAVTKRSVDAAAAAPVDKVTTEQRRHLETLTKQALETAKRVRTERLAAIKAQVRAGTFRPDPGRIAEEILREAELEAQLRAAFDPS